MQLTEEQHEIINSGMRRGCISAFAGTGKTFTLVELAKKNPNKRFLYLAYNRAVREEAESKFPKNTTCRTFHSVAFRAVGHLYQHKLRTVRALDILSECGNSLYLAKSVIGTVYNFIHSDDNTIAKIHIPPPKPPTAPQNKSEILLLAESLWARMVDAENVNIGMEHDGYLKIAQLGGQASSILSAYNSILFDEAQDANPAMVAILRQSGCNCIVVGDPYQAIYAFIGSRNALDDFSGDNFTLTHSFRFGPTVAQLATLLLQRFKDEKHQIIGAGDNTKIIWKTKEISAACIYRPHMLICRTNGKMLETAIGYLLKTIFFNPRNAKSSEKAYHFVGGVREEIFATTLSVFGAMFNRPELITNPAVKYYYGINNTAALEEYARVVGDAEILIALKLCYQHGRNIPDLLRQVRAKNCPSFAESHCRLVTAHRSRGLEDDIVVLADDFRTFSSYNEKPHDSFIKEHFELATAYQSGSKEEEIVALENNFPTFNFRNRKAKKWKKFPLVESDEQEVNLLYVAMTRARKILAVNIAILEWAQYEEGLAEMLGRKTGGQNSDKAD